MGSVFFGGGYPVNQNKYRVSSRGSQINADIKETNIGQGISYETREIKGSLITVDAVVCKIV